MSERDAQHVVLAIDGGNIKTDVALVASDGQLLSLVRGGTSSPHALGFQLGVGGAPLGPRGQWARGRGSWAATWTGGA